MKKLLNPLVTALIGLFVGGLLVFVYFKSKKPVIDNSEKEIFFGQENIKVKPFAPIPIDEAREMIKNLYTYMLKTPQNTPSLFNRSYALTLDEIQSAINIPIKPTDKIKVRIYPGLRLDPDTNKEILSFILMVEKNGEMMWGTRAETQRPENAIQDYWGPCPNNCPPVKDIFSESEWSTYTGRYYQPNPRP